MTGRVVAVTGASAGLGRAIARAFGAAGDDVALLARGEEGLRAAAAEIEAAGGPSRRGSTAPARRAGYAHVG